MYGVVVWITLRINDDAVVIVSIVAWQCPLMQDACTSSVACEHTSFYAASLLWPTEHHYTLLGAGVCLLFWTKYHSLIVDDYQTLLSLYKTRSQQCNISTSNNCPINAETNITQRWCLACFDSVCLQLFTLIKSCQNYDITNVWKASYMLLKIKKACNINKTITR